MPPRFTLVQQPPQQRVTPTQQGGGRFTQVTRPTGSTGSTSQIGAGLGIARGVNTLAGLGARFSGSPNLATASQAASGALGLGTGALQLSQGRTIPGSLAMAGGAGNLAGAAGRFTQIPALQAGGSVLGAAAGLGGIGYGLAQGNQAGDRMAVEGMMGLIGSLVPPLGAAYLGGKIMETAIQAGLGEGMFGQTKLPFGRNNQFSSADNLASQTSMFRGMTGANLLQEAITKAQSPQQLLQLAAMGRNPADPQYNTLLAPHGELQFSHPQFNDPAQFQSMIQQIMQTGDPDLLRQFISGVNIQTGESGATTVNPIVTDWYRRQLVSSLPSPLQQSLLQQGGLFAPMAADQPAFRANDYLQAISQLNQQYAPSGGPQYTREDAIQGLMRGNVGHQQISQAFRPPEQLIDRAAAEKLVGPEFSPAPNIPPGWVPAYADPQSGYTGPQPTPPPSLPDLAETVGTPQWYTKYMAL